MHTDALSLEPADELLLLQSPHRILDSSHVHPPPLIWPVKVNRRALVVADIAYLDTRHRQEVLDLIVVVQEWSDW